MTRLLPLIAVVASGCFGSNPYTEYRNLNNGERANLNFFAEVPAAVGDATQVIVGRREEGQWECASYYSPLSLSGDTTSVECHFAGVLSEVVEVLEATCDQGSCTSQIANLTAVTVVGLAAGSHTLTVRAKLADGTVLTDTTPVRFVAIDAIGLECAREFACPGPNAIIAGSQFGWIARPMSKGQYASGGIRVTVDQPTVVEVTQGNTFTVRALRPGTANVTLRSGNVERVLKLRVAALDEIVSGTVRLYQSNRCEDVVCVDADKNRVGAPAPAKFTAWAPTYVLAWNLRDGTLAVGGAGRITSPTPGAVVNVAGAPGGVNPADLEQMNFTVGGEGGVDCHAGRNELFAMMGAAKLSWTFEQTCE